MNRSLLKVLVILTAPITAACSRTPAEPLTSPRAGARVSPAETSSAAPPLIATKSGWRFPAADPNSGWSPTRKGVDVSVHGPGTGSGGFDVAYTREKGVASGAAFMLPPGSMTSLKSLVIKASATPDQRLQVCLTDANGIVWTLPTMRLTGTPETIELRAADIGPDPFQNAGKSPPTSADWSTMKMITILDISGFMGAPVAACRWRIESVEGVVQ